MIIEINQDIDRYQETVALGLTVRQLVFSIASVVVGGGVVLLLYPHIGLTGSAYVAIPCVAPIALGGFYSYNGMNFYETMGRKETGKGPEGKDQGKRGKMTWGYLQTGLSS